MFLRRPPQLGFAILCRKLTFFDPEISFGLQIYSLNPFVSRVPKFWPKNFDQKVRVSIDWDQQKLWDFCTFIFTFPTAFTVRKRKIKRALPIFDGEPVLRYVLLDRLPCRVEFTTIPPGPTTTTLMKSQILCHRSSYYPSLARRKRKWRNFGLKWGANISLPSSYRLGLFLATSYVRIWLV